MGSRGRPCQGPAPARGAHGPNKTGRFSSNFQFFVDNRRHFPSCLPQANKLSPLSRQQCIIWSECRRDSSLLSFCSTFFCCAPASFMLYFGSLKQKGRGPFQRPVKTALWCLDRYFPPNQTCISCYFDVDSSLFTGLASLFVCFPQFLLCYSLHSFVQPLDLEEEAKKIRAAPPHPVTLHPFHVRWCKSQTRMTIIPEDSKLAQTRTIKELSQILRIKKNLVALRKRIRRKTSTAEDEPKRLLCSVSKQLLYILNSHQPLQMKINELFEKYSKKKEKEKKDNEGGWTTLEETEDMSLEQDHGIGFNQDHRIVPDSSHQSPKILLPERSSPINNVHLMNARDHPRLAMFDENITSNVLHCQTG